MIESLLGRLVRDLIWTESLKQKKTNFKTGIDKV